MPPHLELRFQLQAASAAALARGDFSLAVVSASRGIGTTTGRFIGLLEQADQARAAAVFERLPASDSDTLPVQLSFPPLDPGDAHVTRTPELLPAVISLAEHRPPDGSVIPLKDLAVACDRRRLYLASLPLRRRLDATALHALDLRAYTPPLARFLAEISKSPAAVVTGFRCGAGADLHDVLARFDAEATQVTFDGGLGGGLGDAAEPGVVDVVVAGDGGGGPGDGGVRHGAPSRRSRSVARLAELTAAPACFSRAFVPDWPLRAASMCSRTPAA